MGNEQSSCICYDNDKDKGSETMAFQKPVLNNGLKSYNTIGSNDQSTKYNSNFNSKATFDLKSGFSPATISPSLATSQFKSNNGFYS